LQQTALQLAMLGADEAAEAYMNTSIALADAMSDGIITQEEYKKILEMLGITFDEQGKPIINLKGIMEEFKNKLIETRDQIISFRDTLKSIDGLTVHTWHYHHKVEITERKEEQIRPGGYQKGAWYTPEGWAYLHRGEMVLPRPVADWFRRVGPSINLSVNINMSGTNTSPEEIARAVSREILLRLRGIGA